MRVYPALLILAVCGTEAYGAAELLEQLEDAGAVIEYSYYAEDLAGLERVSQGLSQLEASPERRGLLAYYRGLAAYRLAQLQRSESGKAAANAGRCTDALGEAIERTEGFAEGFALQAACFSLRADLEPIKAVLYRPLADRRMSRAFEVAADNPRVRLLDAVRRHRRGGSDEESLQRFKAALDAFESAASAPTGWPRWGEAETWAYVGEIELARQDLIAARNAIEQALLIAPDYHKARSMLGQIANLSR